MKSTLSPKELARAIGVSESSVKRWIDGGQIEAQRTAGGHRRVLLAEGLRFARASGYRWSGADTALSDEDALRRVAVARRGKEADALYELLESGMVEASRDLLRQLYLDGWSPAEIVDGPFLGAMKRVGELWNERRDGVFLEHRATTVAADALVHLRALLPPPTSGQLAIGGAPAGDPYTLPSLAISAVLRGLGFEGADLGANTPLRVFEDALTRRRPRLLWISATSPGAAIGLQERLPEILACATEGGSRVMLGGAAVGRIEVPEHAALFVGHSMSELAAFVRGLISGEA